MLLAVLGAALGLNAVYGGGPEVLAHHAARHPQNALLVEVQITLSAPAQVFIEYENPQAGQFVTALSAPGTEHRIPVGRLRPATAYAYTIGVQDRHGWTAYGPSGEFATGPLPPELDGLQTRAAGRSSPPLLVTSYTNRQDAYYFFWDETGSIVWYYKVQDRETLEADWRFQTLRQKPNGNLVYLVYRCCLVEITPWGEVVNRMTAEPATGHPHHDFLLLDDDRILYLNSVRDALGQPVNGWGPETIVKIDQLMLWHPAEGRLAEVWDARTSLDIADPAQWAVRFGRDWGRDWLHLNSLQIGAGGNLIMSVRNHHQIVALSPDFRRIEWRLGGLDSDYAFPNPGDRFYGQHTAAQLPNGHILLFDNGNGRPDAEGGAYSRALELRLDEAAGTAVKAWEYRLDPGRYSEIVSSAFRLANGHTLVNFGVASEGSDRLEPLTLVEATPAGAAVFRLELFDSAAGGRFYPRQFRAAAGPVSVMGETMLRPPAAGPPLPEEGWDDEWWRRPVREASAFAPQVAGHRVLYRRAPCHPAEAASGFFLHLYPADPGDLPEERREHGYENRDFRFGKWGTIRGGVCAAEVPLPAYPIARLRTGQYLEATGERLWETELPGPAARPGE